MSLFGKEPEKELLIREVSMEIAGMKDVLGFSELEKDVLAALNNVPRGQFVPEESRYRAWENHAMSIGFQQTISQPFIVAIMTQLLWPEKNHRILEIGTGCGYQAAVLAEIVKQVYSIEVIPELARLSEMRLHGLGYENIKVQCGDGYRGWPEKSPFDGIIVTAGAEEVPQPLMEQLKIGGRLVIPVGKSHDSQMLKVVTKESDNSFRTENIIPVVFVPFVHAE